MEPARGTGPLPSALPRRCSAIELRGQGGPAGGRDAFSRAWPGPAVGITAGLHLLRGAGAAIRCASRSRLFRELDSNQRAPGPKPGRDASNPPRNGAALRCYPGPPGLQGQGHGCVRRRSVHGESRTRTAQLLGLVPPAVGLRGPGACGRPRTGGLRLTRAALWPTELRRRVFLYSSRGWARTSGGRGQNPAGLPTAHPGPICVRPRPPPPVGCTG